MVGPPSGATIRGEPTLLRKLQAAKKEAAWSPANSYKVGSTRMQDIAEEGGPDDRLERREEEVRMKELQSQKARIVAQMVPAQASRASSPFEDTENIPVSASEPAWGNRRVRVHEALPIGSMATNPLSGPPKVNGFDAAAETLCAAFDALAQHQLFRDPSDDVDLPEARVFIASWVDYCNKYDWAMRSPTGRLACTLMTAQRLSLPLINSPSLLVYCFHWS
jgi:cell cycle serine/threonine-protein kinase CDC5/MSD2